LRRTHQSRCSLRVAGRAVAIVALCLLLAPVTLAAPKYKVLHAFTGGLDGGGLYGGVVLGSPGKVFGGTSGGGDNGQGTIFMLTAVQGGRWQETVLHSFSLHYDGESPIGTLTSDAGGNLYGTTATGGANDLGTTFELSRNPFSVDAWSIDVIYEVGSRSGLILDQAGNLYGPIGPGKYGGGAVTELSPGSGGWTETYLYSFCPKYHCVDGDGPDNPFTWDANGDLYGATEGGGKGNLGVIFELERTANGWKEHVLHNFPASATDGYDPDGGLTLDQKGNVYGTTSQGGSKGNGTVFQLTRGTDGRWKETILYNFPDAFHNGGGADAGVIFDRAGNLYGTTPGGGDPNCQCGVVFKMTPGANGKWTYSVLHRFTGADGFDPEAGLTLDSKGNIYGTTVAGGAGGAGVVFEITP
jgi:uncharacterized repeat protein (TIGR03803 family)